MFEPKVEENLKVLENMTDKNGLMQHESDPNNDYSIDDQARALIVLSRFSNDFIKEDLAQKYLDFIIQAKRFDGWFNNYKDAKGNWIKVRQEIQQNEDTLQDCYGRALWGLSEFLSSEYRKKLREKAGEFLFDSLKNTEKLTYPHSLAFTIIGLSKLPKDKQNKDIKRINSELIKKLIENNKDYMTYCVARIPQAMLLSGGILGNKKSIKKGKDSLDMIIDNCFDKNAVFHPIKSPSGDEQPIEAGVMVEACVTAYDIIKKDRYLQSAKNSLEWFNKQNSQKLNMLAGNGAVYDAITEKGTLNKNQGAESILSYLMAISSLNNLKQD